MLIWNVDIDYATEQKLLLQGVGLDNYLPFLVRGINRLEVGGADFLVVPCNTVHELYPEMSQATDLEMLHIVEETAQELSNMSAERVTLLATETTVKSRLYQGILEQRGVECVVPDEETQADLNATVAELVGSGQADNRKDSFQRTVQRYLDLSDVVVLGCTDLHMLVEDSDRVVDSMDVLAVSTANRIVS